MHPHDSDLWRQTLHHSPIGMALVGLDGRLLMSNPALCDLLGTTPERLLGRGFEELTHPDDRAADVRLYEQALAGEIDSYRMRKRYLHADGHVVWGDLSVALVGGPDGTPLHFIGQVVDVTEQHHHEERLRASNADLDRERRTLEAIFETVNVGLLLLGPDGRYERMNRRHQETMSLPFPDGHQGTAGQLGAVYAMDGTTALTQEQMPSYRATHGEEFDDYTYWVGTEPRTRAAFSASARQVRDADGVRVGAALAYQDVTEVLRAIRVQDEFVSSVSHELRTPLASVLGYLEVLQERRDLPAAVSAQLHVIERNAVRLQVLLTDLLVVGQGAAGQLRLQRLPVDLAALAREAVDEAQVVADAVDVELVVHAPDVLVASVDGPRVRQVVDNLLGNALKFTHPGGSVQVELELREGCVELSVTDAGIGISAEEVPHVFSRFFRGTNAVDDQIAGTGLGLNIVETIVTAHGGSVTLDSELGRGTTFRVRLPAPTSRPCDDDHTTG